MIYRFGIFELDDRAGELRRAGTTVAIQPKPLALLRLLIRERARIVPSDELLTTLWPDAVVSPASLNRAVTHARRAIDDTGRGSLIRSFSRRGYRFTGEVVEVRGDAPTEPSRDRSAPSNRDRPAVDDEAGWRRVPDLATRPAGADSLVGRQAALERLDVALDIARSGRGAILLVSGPPGIGKTHLVESFAASAQQQGFDPVMGRCRDREGLPSFWLWTQVLQRLMEVPAHREELERLVSSEKLDALVPAMQQYTPELLSAVAFPPDADPNSPRAISRLPTDQQRFFFFQAAGRLLDACAQRRPLVTILEDLQWASRPSLRLLEHFANEHAGIPLLIVGTVRDELRAPDHPIDQTLALLRRQPHTDEVALGALSRGEVGELLARKIGRAAPADLTSELFARTEGIPLYIVEAMRLLEERGDLAEPERVRRHGVPLPPRAADLIRRSLDGLSESCAALLAVGSVLGREFTLTLLAAVAGHPRAQVLELCDEAIAAGVLEESSEAVATFRFRHALFQEAIYDALTASTRARHHLAAAERLERQHAGALEPVLAELAHHHHRAIAVGDPERSFAFSRRAAAEAERLFAFEEAAEHSARALDALRHCESVDPRERLDTLLSLGAAQQLSGDRVGRLDAFEQALDEARRLEDPEAFARAAIGLCDVSEWSASNPRASSAISEAIERAPEDDLGSRARLTTRLAYLQVQRRKAAEPPGREAVELARRSGDPEALQEALYILHYVIAGPDDLEERRQMIEELVIAAERCANRDTAVIAVLDIACDRLLEGDRPGALELHARARALGGRYASPGMAWHLSVWEAGLALLEGRLEEAEQRATDALARGRRIGHPYARACFNGQMALVDRDRGRPERIVERLGRTLDNTKLGATHWTKAVVGRAEQACGNQSRAQELFADLARSGFSDIARNIRWNGTIVEVAHLCVDIGASDQAGPLLDLLATAPDQHGLLPIPINYSGPVSFATGRLKAMLGLADEAIDCLEGAIDSARGLRAGPVALNAALDLAPLLSRRGESARARSQLEACKADAEAVGPLAAVRQAEQQLAAESAAPGR